MSPQDRLGRSVEGVTVLSISTRMGGWPGLLGWCAYRPVGEEGLDRSVPYISLAHLQLEVQRTLWGILRKVVRPVSSIGQLFDHANMPIVSAQ